MRRGLFSTIGFLLVVVSMVRSYGLEEDLAPEARQVLFGYRSVLRGLPGEVRTALVERLRQWAELNPAEREEVVEVVERLRYIPASAAEVLRTAPQGARWEALRQLTNDRDLFADQPTRAVVVVAGLGVPGEVIFGPERGRNLPRIWGRVRRRGLLLEDVRVPEGCRPPERWQAALLTGRVGGVGGDGRPKFPTICEVVRRFRALPRTGVWVVAAGGMFARSVCSTSPDYGSRYAALRVGGDLFRMVSQRRKAFIEEAVRRGMERSAAEAKARALGPDEVGLGRLFPEPDIRAFVWQRLERDPGAGVTNTFVYLTALGAMQRYRPHLLLVCFGEPGAEYARGPQPPRRELVRSEGDYRRLLRVWRRRMEAWRRELPRRRREALSNLDLYIDYLHREFERNPYYDGRGMFVLVLGDPAQGRMMVVIVGPETPPEARVPREVGLVRIAPTVAKFLGVDMPQARGAPVEEVFSAAAPSGRANGGGR